MVCDRHLINGVALDDLASPLPWEGAVNLPDLAGEDISLPYMVGEIPGTRTVKGMDYSLAYRVIGLDRPDYLDKSEQFLALAFQGGATFTLTREMTMPTGLRTQTATARYVSTSGFVDEAPDIGRVLVRFRLLSGPFETAVAGP